MSKLKRLSKIHNSDQRWFQNKSADRPICEFCKAKKTSRIVDGSFKNLFYRNPPYVLDAIKVFMCSKCFKKVIDKVPADVLIRWIEENKKQFVKLKSRLALYSLGK